MRECPGSRAHGLHELSWVSCFVRQWIHGLRQSRSLCRIFLLFYAKENLDPEVVGLLFGVSESRSMEKCAQSLSVFPVFALEIWTLRYEPLVSGSSCSLFGCTFLAQCLVRLWIHICVFFGAVLGLVVDMSVAVQRQGFGQTVEKTVAPQLHSSLWSLSRLAGRADFRCKCGGDSRLPQMQLIRTCFWTRSLTCLRCVTAGASRSVQKLRILRSCSSSTRCGRPCDHTATSRFSSTVEMPPIQFTARVVDILLCNRDWYVALWRR